MVDTLEVEEWYTKVPESSDLGRGSRVKDLYQKIKDVPPCRSRIKCLLLCLRFP